jgi:hypothetical protein
MVQPVLDESGLKVIYCDTLQLGFSDRLPLESAHLLGLAAQQEFKDELDWSLQRGSGDVGLGTGLRCRHQQPRLFSLGFSLIQPSSRLLSSPVPQHPSPQDPQTSHPQTVPNPIMNFSTAFFKIGQAGKPIRPSIVEDPIKMTE